MNKIDPQAKRCIIWKHNSFFGHVAMMKQQTNTIMNSPTVSAKVQLLAYKINGLVKELGLELKNRIDQE